MMVAIYIVHLNNAKARLRAMGPPVATFHVSESGFGFESGAGSASLPWSAVSEIWQLPQCWLMLMSKSQFVTLPLSNLDPTMQDFVLQQVRASGGKIA